LDLKTIKAAEPPNLCSNFRLCHLIRCSAPEYFGFYNGLILRCSAPFSPLLWFFLQILSVRCTFCTIAVDFPTNIVDALHLVFPKVKCWINELKKRQSRQIFVAFTGYVVL
jgi:hypothetical protein